MFNNYQSYQSKTGQYSVQEKLTLPWFVKIYQSTYTFLQGLQNLLSKNKIKSKLLISL